LRANRLCSFSRNGLLVVALPPPPPVFLGRGGFVDGLLLTARRTPTCRGRRTGGWAGLRQGGAGLLIGLETDDVSGDDEADDRRTAAVSERVMTAGRGRAAAGCASGMPSTCADCSTCSHQSINRVYFCSGPTNKITSRSTGSREQFTGDR